MDKLKLLIISGSFKGMKCGVGNYVYSLAKTLVATGAFDLSILTSDEARPLKDAGFRLFSCIGRWGFFSYKKIIKAIGDTSPDIIHIHYPTIKYNRLYNIGIVLLPFAIKLFFKKIRLVVSIHDFSIGHILNRIKQFPLLYFSDVIVVSNESDRKGMFEMYPNFRGKMKKIYIGSNIEFKRLDNHQKDSMRRELSPNGERLIGYFGFLTKGRNMGLLLYSFNKLVSDDWSLPSKLIIVGSPQNRRDIHYVQDLKRLADKLGIEGKVIWAEGISDEEVSKYLQCMDLCVLPFSRGADLRRTTLVSCIIHEIPVISTVNNKFIMDEELGSMGVAKLIDYNKNDLAYAIGNLLKDAKARELMVHNQREIKNRFSWRDIANAHLNMYRGLIH